MALHTPGKSSTTELHPSLDLYFDYNQDYSVALFPMCYYRKGVKRCAKSRLHRLYFRDCFFIPFGGWNVIFR